MALRTSCRPRCSCLFFFNDTATTEIYTLSLHDALPILPWRRGKLDQRFGSAHHQRLRGDRKSTRLNSSHQLISYAVFCLKKKNGGTVSLKAHKTKAEKQARGKDKEHS